MLISGLIGIAVSDDTEETRIWPQRIYYNFISL